MKDREILVLKDKLLYFSFCTTRNAVYFAHKTSFVNIIPSRNACGMPHHRLERSSCSNATIILPLELLPEQVPSESSESLPVHDDPRRMKLQNLDLDGISIQSSILPPKMVSKYILTMVFPTLSDYFIYTQTETYYFITKPLPQKKNNR